ncbi:hypothetical protein [Paenibacillus sabinae]|uniref:hypothetical protein n=1 Tax=Paenibacillus sabinae TaxID=365617 RepID=UPI00130DA921|nr:hypothetical protein [Paenibacillus sabinae]
MGRRQLVKLQERCRLEECHRLVVQRQAQRRLEEQYRQKAWLPAMCKPEGSRQAGWRLVRLSQHNCRRARVPVRSGRRLLVRSRGLEPCSRSCRACSASCVTRCRSSPLSRRRTRRESLPARMPRAGTPRLRPRRSRKPPQGGAWVARVLKLLGAEHEQLALRGGAEQAAAEPGAVAGGHVGDTVKGVLLQAMGSSDVPAAVKEAAGQLVQHLTGQQLLLNTDRTAPFAQVTLFLPLKGPDGTETASVHIQSRRGHKGELDASNCRLWFDLDMKSLGQTLVDVQVVDRIVSLKLHNNEAWVQELLETSKDDIKSAIETIGYQLSSFKAEAFPAQSQEKAGKGPVSPADYVPDAYRGVDYRI